jgi:predicted kinase
MWLIAMKGPPGSGKSTIARALSKRLAWPLIDKDDIRDLLPDSSQTPNFLSGNMLIASGLSYDIMFHIARRQLLQELSVICDSPLTSNIGYQRAQTIAAETQAALAILECACSNDAQWSQRINMRKTLPLPAHHQTDWNAFQGYLDYYRNEANYPIRHPHLVIDTIRPLGSCTNEIVQWLKEREEQV